MTNYQLTNVHVQICKLPSGAGAAVDVRVIMMLAFIMIIDIAQQRYRDSESYSGRRLAAMARLG